MATPSARFPVPSEVVPLKNWTVPVGVPEAGLTALTVAVRVTFCPDDRRLGEDSVTTVDESRQSDRHRDGPSRCST